LAKLVYMVYTAFCQTCGRTVYLGEDDTRACPVCSSPLVVSETTPDSRAPLDARIAENEDKARSLNERLDRRDRAPGANGLAEFVCECGNANCRKTIEVPIREYEEVRRNPQRFIIATGHEIDDVEVVIDDRRSYSVVEKVARPGDIAEDLEDRN
jgi:DNA-directed RNA polymerase subunit RPC12/RpoP